MNIVNENISFYNSMMHNSEIPGPMNGFCAERLVYTPNVFTPEECEELQELFWKYPTARGTVGDPTEDDNRNGEYDNKIIENLRDCYVTYAPFDDPELRPFLEKIEDLMTKSNNKFWNLEITSFSQPPRIMSYFPGNHFNALHTDHGPRESSFRKLTAIVQLSDPNSYEGGQFELPGEDTIGMNTQGSVLIFPSYLVHRVTPVTSGVRHSLVYRAIGPVLK